jgi:serine/threonine protein kinase
MAREIRQIGQGGFGSVWLHQDEHGLYFARKMFHAGCREYARKEYQMLAQLNHANIIKLAVS